MLAFLWWGNTTYLSDNLKTGVISHPKHDDVVLNHDYEEFGNYYNTAIVSPRNPKGKPSVGGTVGKVTTWIIAKLRNKYFTNFLEVYKVALIALEEFNSREFQKREGTRKSCY